MSLEKRINKLERSINPPDDTVLVRFKGINGELGDPFTMSLREWRAFEKDLLEAGIWTIEYEED
ncbi:MAG: hypothetical protein VR69_00205 [Peptococcaceae bacterium BRH_c4b]|nr:MAG: hypothetical protein VR69_00205 [Peptococcaceae bacterium BRH_c4b]